MKAFHIVLILLLVAGLSAACMWLWPEKPPEPEVERRVEAAPTIDAAPVIEIHVESAVLSTSKVVVAEESPPIQSIEERGDAMLFEIDALQNTPFDQSITTPFD